MHSTTLLSKTLRHFETLGYLDTVLYKQFIVTQLQVEKHLTAIVACTMATLLATVIVSVESIFRGDQAVLLPFLKSVIGVLGLEGVVSAIFTAFVIAGIVMTWFTLAFIPCMLFWLVPAVISTLRLSNQDLSTAHAALATQKLEDARILLGLKKVKDQ